MNSNSKPNESLDQQLIASDVPDYDFYNRGIKEITTRSLAAIIKDKAYHVLVTIITILALWSIAVKTLTTTGQGIIEYSMIGLIVFLIFIIGFKALVFIPRNNFEEKTRNVNATEPIIQTRSP